MRTALMALTFACVAQLAAQTCTIATPTAASTSGNQLVFDVVNLTPNLVRVTQIDVFLNTTTSDVQIWAVTCGGTGLGKTNQAGLWTLVANFPAVTGLGTTAVTPLPPLPTPLDLLPGVTGFYIFRSSGSPQYDSSAATVGAPIVNDGTLEVQVGLALAANFPAALPTLQRSFRGVFHYDCVSPGPPLGNSYQTNSSAASLAINGAEGGACSPTIINQSVFACTPVQPATGTFAFSSTSIGLPWDLAISTAPLVAVGSGAVTFPDGQLVNLNLAAPVSFLNGFLGANWPGVGIPGAAATTLTVNYAISTATDLSFQALWTDPTSLIGLRLSQASELHVAIAPPTVTLPLTLADNATTVVNVTNAPNCWTAGGIPFYGTTYTTMNVISNGRVMFGAAGTTTAAPTVALFASNNPSVGVWTDWNPALGGSVTVSNPLPGIVRVDYSVRFAGETTGPLATFAIEFDTLAATVALDGLTGIPANPQGTAGGVFSATADSMLMGISRGAGLATTPSATTFTPATAGFAFNTTDAWYDFYSATNPGNGRCASLVPGTLNRILFTPSATVAPNYDWVGF